MSRRREIGVSILETCWRAHITIVTLCHSFVVYHIHVQYDERGQKQLRFHLAVPKELKKKMNLFVTNICTIMGQIIWFFVKSQQSFFKCCDLKKKVEIFFRWSKQLDQEFRCRNQDLDIKQNHMSWPNIIVIHTYDIYFYSSYSSIDVALIFPRAFFWYFTDENA